MTSSGHVSIRPHPHVLASVVGALMLGVGGLLAPRPGAVPSSWPPPWATVWYLGAVVTCTLVLVGMAACARTGSVAGWLVQRAGHVAAGSLHGSYAFAAAAALGWNALDAAGFVGSLALAHLWLAWRMGRELDEARDATRPPGNAAGGAGWT